MISWNTQRKLLYTTAIAFFGVFALVIASFLIWYERPNCFDHKKNGDELGTDCGGSCSQVCTTEVPGVIVQWVRFFKVKDGVFSVAAYVQNPNQTLEALSVPYRFKLYKEGGVVIAEVSGASYIPPGQAFGVFEGGINVGSQIPARVTFEWMGSPTWQEQSGRPDTIYIKEVVRSIDNQGLPRIDANIENGSLQEVHNLVGFAVVYGRDGNAIAASRTVIDAITGGGKDKLVFSWPTAFGTTGSRVEVLHWSVPGI